LPGWAFVAALAGAFAVAPSGVLARGDIPPAAQRAIPTVSLVQLPPEARATLRRIREGGPFPYERDGTVFGNFERRLPAKERGYYREYTVPTPGVSHRGARRIVAGPEGEYYYTDDHYRSFKRVMP
jgi:ribonuclease T1